MGAQALPTDLSSLRLDLGDVEVSTDMATAFLKALPTKLREMDLVLRRWELGNDGITALETSLSKMANLARISLDLKGCELEEESIQSFSPALFKAGNGQLRGVQVHLAENNLSLE